MSASTELTLGERFRRYQRAKRIQRIRRILDDPWPLTRRRRIVSGHSLFRLALTCALMLPATLLCEPLARGMPRLAGVTLRAAALYICVEAADWVWLRLADALDVAAFVVATVVFLLLIGGGVYVKYFPPKEPLGPRIEQAFEGWRQRLNERYIKGIQVHTLTEGRNWKLATEAGRYQRLKIDEARAFCSGLGPGFRLPDSDELKDLDPHPALRYSLHVWVAPGSHAGLSARRKG